MKSATPSKIRWALLLVLACAVCCRPAPSGDNSLAAVRAHIEQLVAEGEVPSLAIAVARDGEIVWEQGFGLADRERNMPATEHTPYPLASLSKPLTATGLMVLVEQGLIDLDAPIDDYLGETKLRTHAGDAAQATVRRVAHHTSGLPLHAQHFYSSEPRRPPSMDETIQRYGILVTAPGERYQYSNLGYGLLGHVIARVFGQSYAQVMKEQVFRPLGMDHTSVYLGSDLEKGQAVKYTRDGRTVPPCETDSPGASAIYGSAHDLIRFAMFHLKTPLPDQKAILSNTALDEMPCPSLETGPLRAWECEGSGYGLGWSVGVTEDGLRVVQHAGGTLGVSTVLALVPDEHLAVVVLSNTDSQWMDAILIETLCALLSRTPDAFLPTSDGTLDERTLALPAELIGEWQGNIHTYKERVPFLLEISGSGAVYATLGKQPRTALQQASYQDDVPQFMNVGGGPYLRGWFAGELDTDDVARGAPCKLWLELKLRNRQLTGSLVAFSQRTFYTGPLSHWVMLDGLRPALPASHQPEE